MGERRKIHKKNKRYRKSGKRISQLTLKSTEVFNKLNKSKRGNLHTSR